MIDELYIKDFALIQELRLTTSRGLNIITGETGAGKSIILGALNLLLGSRATTDMIKTGAARSVVEGSFSISDNPDLESLLQERGVYDEEAMILKREITVEGKGRSFINSQQVPVSFLKEVGRYLVDIHGQNENQNILNTTTHRAILDRFCNIEEEVTNYKKLFTKREELKQQLKSVSLDEQEKNRRLEVLNHEIQEIEVVQLKDDAELEELQNREKLLEHSESLVKNLSDMYGLLQGDDRGILKDLSFMERTLEKDSQYDDSLVDVLSPVRESYLLLSDAAAQMRDKADSVKLSPEEIQTIKERIDSIHNVLRKYGPGVEETKTYLEKAKNELAGIELSGEEEIKFRNEIQILTKKMIEDAEAISRKRKEAAGLLEEAVSKELGDLGMGRTKIRISMKWQYGDDGEFTVPEEPEKKYILHKHGLDMVELLLGQGENDVLRPLRKIASGGEMSRIMLALKKIIIESDPVSTLVFDEVDTGVGGGVAEAVGKKIASLSDTAQVFVITHLHQVAGLNSKNVSHFCVSKDVTNGTRITRLSTEERVGELARMIAGKEITQSALDHARTLLNT